MRALVTGGAGFIGSHVVDCLLEYGWDVVVMDNYSTGTPANVDAAAETIYWDITGEHTAEKIIELKPDAIFHLAAQTDVQTSIRQSFYDLDVNLLGTLRVLGAARTIKAKLVFASTGGAIYGECWFPCNEDDKPDPHSPYAVSKLAAEHYLLLWNELHDMKNVVLRYSNVYGPRQSARLEGGVVAIFKDRIAQGLVPTVYGDGEQTRDFIHVKDVTDATVSAVNLRGDIYNVGTGYATTINQLAETLGAEVCDYQAARPGDVRKSVIDSTKLREQLIGWNPRVINETLLR